MSGHYTAIALRNGQWFNLDDSQVSEILGLTARNQEAYILMCKRNTTKKINTVSPISFPHPNQSSIEIFDSTPSNYYIEISSTSYCAPRVCRTKRSNERLIYKPISEFQAKQAKLKAYEDQDPSTHSRLKGYLSKDLLSLHPGSWLNNFVLNKYIRKKTIDLPGDLVSAFWNRIFLNHPSQIFTHVFLNVCTVSWQYQSFLLAAW
jgi:hypothetical protein